MATNGLVLIKPTTVDKTGASSTATINTGGSVTFDLCETLSLNGVFSSTYDNYIVDLRCKSDSSGNRTNLRLRAAGTDNSTANSYTSQLLLANGTSVTGSRQSSAEAWLGTVVSTDNNGQEIFLYGPHLAQPTAMRGLDASQNLGGYIADRAVTHNQSTSYDGFTIWVEGLAFTGLIKVYGLVK